MTLVRRAPRTRCLTWLAFVAVLLALPPAVVLAEDVPGGEGPAGMPVEAPAAAPADEDEKAVPSWFASDEKVGIDEKLGETIPLDLVFFDEEGRPVELGSLIERPTILMLVYFGCPSICAPLMHEVAGTVDRLDLEPGIDFDLITVSFHPEEGPELAKVAKEGLLGEMARTMPPDSWHFLTGDPLAISKLADAVGFRFRRESDTGEYVHAGTVIFLTKEGTIVRYLGGLKLLPFDVKMAVIDAMEGRPRSVVQRIQALCYSYDEDRKAYAFRVDRLILIVTLGLVAVFLMFLLIKGKRREPTPKASSDAAKEGPA